MLLVVLLFAFAAAMPQSKNKKHGTVTGLIYSKSENTPLQNVAVQLYLLPDTIYKGGAASNPEGRFSLNVEKGNYLMRISCVGFLTHESSLTIAPDKINDLGRIIMSDDVVALKEALVTAEAPPVTMTGDTMVYNSSAFRVAPGSMLEELLKKYPGVEIAEDGTITVNGKTVNRILMKGKDFFGTDKNAALKNVPAENVDRVKFYDKQSDFVRITGIDDGEEEAVLDLQMKKGADEGFFANIDLAYGTKDRYSAKFTPNYYTDHSQYSLILSANNVNDRGFSGRGRGGLTAAKEGKFNFAAETANVEVGGNVRYDHRDTDNSSFSSTEYFMTGTSNQFSNSRNKSFGRSTGINGDFRIEWKPDTLTNIIFTPSFSYSTSDNWSQGASATFLSDPFETISDYPTDRFGEVYGALEDIAINSNNNENMGNNDSKSINANLQINRRLGKPGRNITFRGGFNYGDSESKSFSTSKVRYYRNNSGNEGYDRKRYSTTPGENWRYNLRLSYTEPIITNLFLQISYNFTHSYQNSDRATFVLDSIEGYNPLLSHNYDFPGLPADYEQYRDDDLSRFSIYRTSNHNAQLMLRYVTEKMNLSAGITWMPQSTKMTYKYLDIDTVLKRTVYNITPNLRLRYKWNKTTTLNVMYRGSTSQPSLTNLLDITDDSDPLNITKGNPGLKPSFTNRLMAFFNTYNTDTQTGMTANLNFSNTLNSISNKVTYIEETGGRITQPDNINGNWNAGGGFGYNSTLPNNNKFTYSTHTNVQYAHRVSYISPNRNSSSVRSTVETTNLNEALKFGFRNDVFEVSLDGRVNYSHSYSKLQPENNLDTWNFSYGPSGNVTLPWYKLTLSTNLSMQSRRGFDDPSFNTNELMWNAQLSASFLASNALTVTFQLYDILHQQSNISRNIDALMRSDTQNNSIYSYGMLHVIYKINSGNRPERGQGRGPAYGGPGGGRGFGGRVRY